MSAVPKYAYRATHFWLSSHAMAPFKNFSFSSSLPCGWNCVGESWLVGLPADFAHRHLRRLTSVTHTGRLPAMRHMSDTKVLKSSKREHGLYCNTQG